MVPSAAMGRDIPVAFLAGGPHAVYLLDAFNAAPDVSNWVTAGNAMNTLAGKGISVVAPAGGAYSMYTDWEQDGSKQWDTFLSSELPDWLAANKGLAPGGHGGRRCFARRIRSGGAGHLSPRPIPLRRIAVGIPSPERTAVDGAITAWPPARRRRQRPHVGCTPAGSLEVAFPEPERPAAGGQQHPAVGLQPGQWSPDRPRRDGRQAGYRPRHQRDVLLPLPRRRRHTTATSTWAAAGQRLADLEHNSWVRCPATSPLEDVR